MKPMRRIISILASLAFSGVSATAAEQLPNLPEANPKPRFPVTDRVWPAGPEDAKICLWKDDKLAAVSITVDDNSAPDIAWWLEMSGKYGFPVTWFLITGRVSAGNDFFGTWALYSDLLAKGHDVESHSVTHLSVKDPGWGGVEWEYAESLKQIEAGIPGHRVRSLAYPGGENQKLNDPELAAKYYASARGVTGLINPPNKIPYMNVSSVAASLDDPKVPWADLRNLVTPGRQGYRGWAVLLYHLVKEKEPCERIFQFLAENKNDIWTGLFSDVAAYGQERDTATLSVRENSPKQIVLDLTDGMDDTVFTCPLTLKVKLPENWANAKAVQDGKATATNIVENNGSKFLLVEAIPDRGQIVLSPD